MKFLILRNGALPSRGRSALSNLSVSLLQNMESPGKRDWALPVSGEWAGDAARVAEEVLEGYGHFWKNLAFQRGWAKPPFTQQSVVSSLRAAADIVVSISVRESMRSLICCIFDRHTFEFIWKGRCSIGS